jgi:hypothetical protein
MTTEPTLKTASTNMLKKIKFLMVFTSCCGYSLVSIRNCFVINALDDDNWIEDVYQYYPK